MSDIYREQIIEHSKNPRNQGTLDPNDTSYEDTNPLCGDRVRIDLRISGDTVEDVAFSGRGCAISQASASMLTEMIKGQPLEEIEQISREDILDELGVPISPARMKCALLGLHVLQIGIDEYKRNHDAETG